MPSMARRISDEMAGWLGSDDSTLQTLNGAYPKLLEKVDEKYGPGNLPLRLPRGAFADDFGCGIDAFHESDSFTTH